MSNTAKYILIGIALLVLVVLGYFGYKYFLFTQIAPDLPSEGTVVVFSERGIGKQFRFVGNGLVAEFPQDQDGITIYEQAQSPLNISEKIVLGSLPEIPGMFAGVVKEDGTIVLLMTGGTNKAELAVSKNGFAVFTARDAQVTDTASMGGVQGEEAKESATEETFSIEGEGVPELQLSDPSVLPQLFAIELETGAMRALGAGRNPRFTADGSLIAVAQNGVVKVDPVTGQRAIILPYTGPDALYGAVSLSGKVVAFPADDYKSLVFYSLENTDDPEQLGILQLENPGRYATVFADDEHFFLRTRADMAWFYKTPTAELPTAVPVAIVPISR